MPFFSIILPTYNRGKKIAGTISKILAQDFNDFELLVIDDGSTDDTEKVIKAFTDDRIIYHFKQNEERAVARNYGIQRSLGDYVTFVDSDDAVYRNYLSAANDLCEDNNPAWMHLNYEIKDEAGQLVKKAPRRKGDLARQLVTGNHLSCVGVFVKREILMEEKFDEDPRLIGSEDYDLWLRIARNYPLTYSNEVSAAIVQHKDRSVMGFSKEKLTARIMYLLNKHTDSGIFSRNEFRTFKAHRYLYLSLHFAMGGFTISSIKFVLKAIRLRPSLVSSMKMWAAIKNLAVN